MYRIGYYAPQLINWLTYSLFLIPIGGAHIFPQYNLADTPLTRSTVGLLCLFSLITLVPQMTNRHQTYESGTHTSRSTAESLFWGATYMNTLVSLTAFIFSLVLFVSAHEQFRMLGVRPSTSLIGSGAVDNTPVNGDGLRYGPCLWMQATSLVVVLLTPMIRVVSRVREERSERSESVALGRQSMQKV